MLGSLLGCAYESEEELFPSDGCKVDNVSYNAQVVPILETNCYSCHGIGINTSGITLEGYSNLITRVNSGRLLGAIKRESGFPPMPQNAPMLPDCFIRQIEEWIGDGAPDN